MKIDWFDLSYLLEDFLGDLLGLEIFQNEGFGIV
jgi:hypothetical protein